MRRTLIFKTIKGLLETYTNIFHSLFWQQITYKLRNLAWKALILFQKELLKVILSLLHVHVLLLPAGEEQIIISYFYVFLKLKYT